jgi:hypothetical protein
VGQNGLPVGVARVRQANYRMHPPAFGRDLLVDAGASRVVVVGVSKGAEGALNLVVVDDRVDGVVALSPSSVSCANLGRCAACRRTPRR